MTERQPIDPALRRYLDEQLNAGPIRSASDARSRMMRQLKDRQIPGLPNAVRTEDHWISARGTGGVRVRVYLPPPPARKPLPVLVYLHGGGWVAGSIETHDPFCRLLAPLAGLSIVSVDYRRPPESPYPAALEDAERAVLWTAGNTKRWGADGDLFALGGDSAGANLAAVLANRLAVDRNAPKPRALALLYPALDHPSGVHASYAENATGYGLDAATMRWYWDQYARGVSPDDPSISPLRAPMLSPLPPTLVATAQFDVLRDEGIAYARKLEEAGVPVTHMHSPDMHHDFPVRPGTVARFPQSDRALAQIAAWLRATLVAW
jgi:acetyl esterase